jgi:hypothetical protein
MITNDQELIATQERIVKFQGWLRQMRQTAQPVEFEAVAGGYRLEIERMQAEVDGVFASPTRCEAAASTGIVFSATGRKLTGSMSAL